MRCKTFPRSWAGRNDTHELGTVVPLQRNELERHWLPFRRAIECGVDAVLVSHASYPALDKSQPAALSKTIIDEILRKELRFSGLVISDDLDMGAILNLYSIETATKQCIKAGCDLVSVCHSFNHQLQAYQALTSSY